MGTSYSTIGKFDYSNYKDVFEKDHIEDIKKIREGFEYKPFDSENINNFYALEQLCCIESEDLLKLCKKRNIKVDDDKPLEQKILDWQIEMKTKKWSCKTFQETYYYYKGSGYGDLNRFLRNTSLPFNFYPLIAGDNTHILHCIYQLDNFIEKDGIYGDYNKYVYRGITPPELIILKRSMKKNNDKKVKTGKEIYFESLLMGNGFVSTSKNIKTALTIVKNQNDEYNCCILKFKIPKEIKFLDIDTESDEAEIIIQRNIIFKQFNKLGYDKIQNMYVIECQIYPFDPDIKRFYKDNSILDKLK